MTHPTSTVGHPDQVAHAVYAVWRYNGHRLGDAINKAGIDFESLPQFVLDTLVPQFELWEAKTPYTQRTA